MQAKIDTLRVKDENGDEYLLYPRTLTKSVIDEDGNTLANMLTDIDSRLSTNVDDRFLTEDGYGGLRYYNAKFQYYDDASAKWVDAQATTDNSLLVTLVPQPMKSFTASCEPATKSIKLRFTESPDTIVDGQALCIIEKVIIIRKKDSVPTDENDGDLVLEIRRRDFGTYTKNHYIDTIDGAEVGDVYYYKAFPVSASGIVANLPDNETSCTITDCYLYGFKIDQNESDPSSMITYLADCNNANYASAYMDYTADSFNYGDWADAWFIQDLKPVMLTYDGTVAYELDKNDYSAKADGTISDVANASFEGNAMMGIPKVYWKIVDNGDNTAKVYISNARVDDDFHCWSHIDNNGNEIDYCYMPIYNGYYDGTTLRSLSGKSPYRNQNITNIIAYAGSNNQNSNEIWQIQTFADIQLINLLLLLIGKSTNTQTVFGNGNSPSGVESSLMTSGTMNNKGLFYGASSTATGVKVFGMEHWWGNMYRWIYGCIYDNGTRKVKMTYGKSDGSTTNGYNTTGDGYIKLADSAISGSSGGYITRMMVSENGLLPKVLSGSASTYYADGATYGSTSLSLAAVGGSCANGDFNGAFSCSYNFTSGGSWTIGASLSCKPLATT